MLLFDRTAPTALASLYGAGAFLEGLRFRCERPTSGTKRHSERQHQRRDQQRYALSH